METLTGLKYKEAPGRAKATDFHVELTSDAPITFSAASVSARSGKAQLFGPTRPAPPIGNNTQDVMLNWNFPMGMPNGYVLDGTITITQRTKNAIMIKNAYFTDGTNGKDGKTPQSNVPGSFEMPGFEFKDPSLNETFFIDLGSGFTSPVWISGLQFMINQREQNFSNFSFFSPNYTPPQSTSPFEVLPGSSSMPFTIAGIEPGTFIYAEAMVADSPDLSDATFVETMMIGHETPTPEPSVFLLVAVGLGEIAVRYRKHY